MGFWHDITIKNMQTIGLILWGETVPVLKNINSLNTSVRLQRPRSPRPQETFFGAHARLDGTPDYNTKKAKQLIEVSSEFAF